MKRPGICILVLPEFGLKVQGMMQDMTEAIDSDVETPIRFVPQHLSMIFKF
jgi:hypothetical protein